MVDMYDLLILKKVTKNLFYILYLNLQKKLKKNKHYKSK